MRNPHGFWSAPCQVDNRKNKIFGSVFPPCSTAGREFLCCIGIMKFHRCHTVKSLLETRMIVEIDVVFYCMNQFISICKFAEIVHFRFQHSPETLHRTVVNASSDSVHDLPHFSWLDFFIESLACVLISSVTMEQRMCIFVVIILYQSTSFSRKTILGT